MIFICYFNPLLMWKLAKRKLQKLTNMKYCSVHTNQIPSHQMNFTLFYLMKNTSLFSCHALFSFPPYLQRAPRWEKGTIRTRSGKTFTGVFPGSLLLSIPEQPSLFMLASALCLIICPDSVSAGGAANAAPAQVKSLAAGSCKASHGSWRTLRGSLFCPGGYPYCWYAIFKEQRGAFRAPHCPPENCVR